MSKSDKSNVVPGQTPLAAETQGSAAAIAAVAKAVQDARNSLGSPAPSPATAVPGLDVEGATARLAGNRKLYLKTLTMFCQGLPKYMDELLSALREDDRERLQRSAHTVKGLCATVGARDVAEAAAEVEHGLDSRPPDEASVTALVDLLRGLADNIIASGLLAPADEGQAPAGGNGKQALTRLRALLADNDGGAMDFFAANKAALAALLSADALARTEDCIRGYDFDEAAEILGKAAG